MTPEQYREALLEPIRAASPPAPGPLPDLPARIWFEPHAPEVIVGFRDLYETGVVCGHRETRIVLDHRIREVDDQLERLRAARDHASEQERRALAKTVEMQRAHERHAGHLEEAIAQARSRVHELETSTFWRMTRPLRAVAHRLKGAARLARGARHQARLLPARLANARQIARDEGLGRLVERLGDKLLLRTGRAQLKPRAGLAATIHPLEIPAADMPLISVIVPAYGQDLHTFTCLRALAEEAARVPLEVIVMDDCAPTPAEEALRAVRGVHFHRNATNLGFVRNCNAGATLARGEYLLFLNNDAVVAPGSLEALAAIFERHPDAGAAGAKLVYPDGRLQEAGGVVWRDGSGWNYGKGDDPSRPEYSYVREVDYCSGACLMVPRSTFHELGGFDELYQPAYYEDSDLCFRIRAAGKKVYYQPAAEVVHFEGVSHGRDLHAGVKKHQVENQARFAERWKAELGTHRVNGVLPRLERDRAARHRVLLVDACMLMPDQDAGSVRTRRLMHVMQKQGAKVTFIPDNLQPLEPYAGRLRQEGIEVVSAPHANSVESFIADHGAEYDLVVLSRYYVASRYIRTVRKFAPRALLVLDTIDLHFLRARRLAELEASAALAQSARAIREQELECIRQVDVTWVVSPFEAELLAREVPSANVAIQTMIHEAAEAAVPYAQREGIMFVGGYRHPPNVDAALYYCREIVPRLRERLPGVKSYIIGSNPPPSLASIQDPAVEVLGFVPDIEAWFDRCRLSVSPLRYGAGIKGKINHSMSRGLPVVATSVSVEGMNLVDGQDVLVADDPEAFAAAIARAYCDESLWRTLSQGGLANVRRYFSSEAAAEPVARVFELARRKASTFRPA